MKELGAALLVALVFGLLMIAIAHMPSNTRPEPARTVVVELR